MLALIIQSAVAHHAVAKVTSANIHTFYTNS